MHGVATAGGGIPVTGGGYYRGTVASRRLAGAHLQALHLQAVLAVECGILLRLAWLEAQEAAEVPEERGALQPGRPSEQVGVSKITEIKTDLDSGSRTEHPRLILTVWVGTWPL